ncbi:hypothetical protein DLAC_05401 [Tieghemostelium lacteum]|uniref:Orc1-like AAA ATPase domain-containing protein n=1 Tax=Tieghemostelium lacteum TaxID=361077 RepID=A0A151ZFS0_TIELA|nr:hypothetical protein DLAC_05401 [Tieghemostelium lacteum]|eukprot:KYQ92816.1 hypothetical protein DLAC_05401 [Tieghemostelium lacteum]
MYDSDNSTSHLSTYVSSTIVNKYLKNPFPLDRETPDIANVTVPVLCLKFYSVECESNFFKSSSYLQFTEESFKIIKEEGGDIISNFNGQEIYAIWKDGEGEEIQTLSRRATKCAMRIKNHLLSMVSTILGHPVLGHQNHYHQYSSNSMSSSSMGMGSSGGIGIGSNYQQQQQQQQHTNQSYSSNPMMIPTVPSTATSHNFPPSSPPINIMSSSHSSYSSNANMLLSTSVVSPPSLLSQQIQQMISRDRDRDTSHGTHNHQQQQQHNLKESQMIYQDQQSQQLISNFSSTTTTPNHTNSSTSNSNSPYITLPSQAIIVPPLTSNHSNSNSFLNSPSSPTKYIHSPIQRSTSSSQLVNQNQRLLVDSSNPSQHQHTNNCFDPLFNIYITHGDLYLGCIGGENNTWLNLIGGEGIIKLNRMIRIYENKHSITSFPVKLSKRNNNTSSSININNNNNSNSLSNTISNSILNSNSNNIFNINTSNNSLSNLSNILNQQVLNLNNNNNSKISVNNNNNNIKISTKLISSNSPPSSPSPSTSPTNNLILPPQYQLQQQLQQQQQQQQQHVLSMSNGMGGSNSNYGSLPTPMVNGNTLPVFTPQTLSLIFNQIIVNGGVFNLIKSYSVCDYLLTYSPNDYQSNNNCWQRDELTSSTSSFSTNSMATEELYIFKNMKELSKPVSFHVEKTMKELPPELFIQIHNLLWCHLPIHVKSLAQASTSTSIPTSLIYDTLPIAPKTTSPDANSGSLLSQDWRLEPRNVTFIVIHFFQLTFKWETLNFFHPVIVKLQELVRKSDGTVSNIIEREFGTFVICTMGLPPFPPQNHAINGVKVSMDILRLLQAQNQPFIRDVNVMVLTEKIISGMIGCKGRSEYVMIGNSIHYSFQWLSNIHNYTSTPTKPDDQQPLQQSLQPPPIEGGFILCDSQTKKLCGKSIIFENINYVIQYRVSRFQNVNNNNSSTLSVHSASNGNLSVLMENETLNEMSIVIPLQVQNSDDNSSTNANGDNILTVQTYRPLKLAHTTTTKDRQQRLLSMTTQNGGNKKRPFMSSESSQFLDSINLLGRSKEVSEIMDRFQMISENLQTSFTLIQGDEGVGKSSLVTEIYKECVDKGGRVLCGSCSMVSKSKPYSAWTGVFSDLFFSEFSLDETRYEQPQDESSRAYRNLSWSRYSHVQKMPIERIRQYIFEKFTDQREEMKPLLSLLNPVLRIDFPSNEVVQRIMQVSTTALLEKTFDLLTYFLRNFAYRSKLVVILEDIQDMDEISWKFLMYVTAQVKPIMIICTSRPFQPTKELLRIKKVFQQQQQLQEEQQKRHSGNQQRDSQRSSSSYTFFDYNEYTLQPLKNEVMVELIKRILGAKTVSKQVIDYILPRAEGNPFVCFDITKDLKEKDYIVGFNDRYTIQPYQLTKPFPSFPESLEGFYLLKFTPLSNQNNSFSIILKSISVIQSSIKFPFSLIHSLCPVSQKRTFFKEIIQKLLDCGILESKERSQLTGANYYPVPSNLTRQSSISSSGSSSSSYSSIIFKDKEGASSGGISRGDRDDFSQFSGGDLSGRGGFFHKTAPGSLSSRNTQTREFMSPNGQKHYIARDENMFSTQPSNSSSVFLDNSSLYSSIISNDWDNYYSFKSPLLQEVIYHTLLGNQKQSLHLKLAKWIEDNYTEDDLDSYNQQLAYHWSKTDQSQNYEKALQYTYKSGELSFQNNNYIDTIRYFYDYIVVFKSFKYRQLGKEFSVTERNSLNGGNSQDQNQSGNNNKNSSGSSSKKSSTKFVNACDDYIIKANDDEFPLSLEERIAYCKPFKYIGWAYHSLGFSNHSEAYLIQALTLLKESPPKQNVNSTTLISIIGQFTKYSLKFLARKNYQPYREALETILSTNVSIHIEASKILSMLADLYYRSAHLVQSISCSARAIQLIDSYDNLASSLIVPQLSVCFSQLSLTIVVYSYGPTISQSFYKHATSIVHELLPGYLELGNSEAINTLIYSRCSLALKEMVSHLWDKLDANLKQTQNLFEKYPGKISQNIKDFHDFIDATAHLYRGDIPYCIQLLTDRLKNPKLGWSMVLSFNHLVAISYLFQGRYRDALKQNNEADQIRPSNEGVEHFIIHQAICAVVQFAFGNIKKSIEEIGKVMELVGGDRVTCGIRYTYALSFIVKVLLSIYEFEKKRKTLPVFAMNECMPNIIDNYVDNPIESNDELLQIPEDLSSPQSTDPNNFSIVSNNDKPQSKSQVGIVNLPTSEQQTDQIKVNPNNILSQSLSSLVPPSMNGNQHPPGLFRTATSATISTSESSISLSTISPSSSFANLKISGTGTIKIRTTPNTKPFPIDSVQLEAWIKKIIKSFKETEKGSSISVTAYQRLSGIYLLIIHGTNSHHRQKGLANLYKSTKESKSKELPLEEAFAWHEIYRFEENPTKKQQAANYALELYQKLKIQPWSLIGEIQK